MSRRYWLGSTVSILYKKKIGDGCHLNRKIDDLVLGASFEITSLKRFHLPSVPKFSGHCYQGIAAKLLSSD